MDFDSSIKEKFFQILSDPSYGMINAPTDPVLGFEILCTYLLPKGWYSTSGGGAHQVNTEIIYEILMKHSKEFRKETKKYFKAKKRD